MPETRIAIFKDDEGFVPLLKWLDRQPRKVKAKCIEKIELLAAFGYELRRPDCDYLTEGIYELRAKCNRVNYRILYGFHGKNAVMLSHACTKTDKVPKREINRAIGNLKKFTTKPEKHTYKQEG